MNPLSAIITTAIALAICVTAALLILAPILASAIRYVLGSV